MTEKSMGQATLDRLAIFEIEDAYVLAAEDDLDDWIVHFRKSAGFPARRWADRMAQLYNQRQKAKQEEETGNKE